MKMSRREALKTLTATAVSIPLASLTVALNAGDTVQIAAGEMKITLT